eukprot:CAMPEP_0114582402 /NCGR_PEP_ID=MMETSP0125-20121206/6397_1 /TAXON_ID=485358 ORGANISM="Aristerostoma sp., Strain ATCC 50986" /NCGR_SAMPLE_ID=MMETSP0125 /ASSEMBLY_ACC=CAM_ASM_000245 /LENGTH=159 /DNA_ID=CAMNT_0001775347 /DNA_START=192 /DNA_END=671 /DNA_ORIENTATION=+
MLKTKTSSRSKKGALASSATIGTAALMGPHALVTAPLMMIGSAIYVLTASKSMKRIARYTAKIISELNVESQKGVFWTVKYTKEDVYLVLKIKDEDSILEQIIRKKSQEQKAPRKETIPVNYAPDYEGNWSYYGNNTPLEESKEEDIELGNSMEESKTM